jgi:hypothetical protein
MLNFVVTAIVIAQRCVHSKLPISYVSSTVTIQQSTRLRVGAPAVQPANRGNHDHALSTMNSDHMMNIFM